MFESGGVNQHLRFREKLGQLPGTAGMVYVDVGGDDISQVLHPQLFHSLLNPGNQGCRAGLYHNSLRLFDKVYREQAGHYR